MGQLESGALLTFVETAKVRVLAGGSIGEAELTELMASLRAHLEDPGTIVVAELVFQACPRGDSNA
jgi:hypothetical protein